MLLRGGTANRGTARRIGLVSGVAVAAAAAATATLVFAAPAGAHVTVNPTEAVPGGFARVAFRVPTESDTASTTKVEVHFPENAPVPSVSTMPVPGWTVSTQRRTLPKPIEVHGAPVSEVVSTITWTAAGADAGIKPGQFHEFPVSMGPLPTVDAIVFKVLQTYSDGNVARWIDEPVAGQEAESPAPVLKLVAKPAVGASAGTGAAGGNGTGAAGGDGQGGGSGGSEDDSGTPMWLGIVGLIAGLGGLTLGGLAFMRTRKAQTVS